MTDLTLIIGNKNYSSWSLRPWILLRHFKVPFTEKRIALFTDTMEQELAIYGSDTKVPVLQDGELVVWDSLAILEYVSERYLDNQGWPENVNARAVARSVCAEMHSSFPHLREALPMNCRKHFKHYTVSDKTQRDINRVKEIWAKCRTEYGQHGEWLFGDFSAVDAMYAPVVLRFAGYDVKLNKDEQAYIDTVLSHPDILEWIAAGKAEQEVIELDEIELPSGTIVEPA